MYRSRCAFDAFEIAENRSAPLKGLVLPLRLAQGEYWELTLQQVPAEQAEVEAEAAFLAELEALWAVPQDSRVLGIQCDVRRNDDGSYTASAYVLTLEQIGEQSPILTRDTRLDATIQADTA